MATFTLTFNQVYRINKNIAPEKDEIIQIASDTEILMPELSDPETGDYIESDYSDVNINFVKYDENGFDDGGKLERLVSFKVEVNDELIDDDAEDWLNSRLIDYSISEDWVEFEKEDYKCGKMNENQDESNLEANYFRDAYTGGLDAWKEHVKNGINPNICDDVGDTPLHLAANYAHDEVCEFLLKNGAILNAKNDRGQIPLHKAIMSAKHFEIAALLLKNGADVNAKDEYDQTALMAAALSGKNETAKLLLENRADPNVVDKFGGTALGKAKIKDDSALIKMLEEWGARD
jgi:hypothetical protein